MLYFPIQKYDEWVPSGYAILGAKSPRGDYSHAVVVLDGEVVWDPHPERAMGLGKREDYTIFQALNPASHK